MLQIQKPLNFLFFLAILSMGSVFSFTFVSGQALDLDQKTKDAIEDLEDKDRALKARIKAYEQIIDLKKRQGATLADQVEGLQAQADKLQLEIDVTNKKITDLKSQIDSLSHRVSEKSLLIDRQKRMLSELMRVYYADFTSDSTPLFLTSAESLLYFKQEDWTTDVSSKVSDLLDSVKTLRDTLANEHRLVADKKQEVDELYKDLEERNKSLEATKKSKAALLAKTQAEENKYEALVDDLQKQREDLENEIEDLESGKSLAGLPDGKRGLLAYPVKNVRITQGYGKTSYSNHYVSGKHNGIDFGGPTGTTIMAAADGKVVGTGDLGRVAYGKWITINHGNGIVTLYGHLSKISVSKGESVKKGEKIGAMGNTGDSTGPHLHFTVYAADSYELVDSRSVKGKKIPIGASVNPRNYLP